MKTPFAIIPLVFLLICQNAHSQRPRGSVETNNPPSTEMVKMDIANHEEAKLAASKLIKNVNYWGKMRGFMDTLNISLSASFDSVTFFDDHAEFYSVKRFRVWYYNDKLSCYPLLHEIRLDYDSKFSANEENKLKLDTLAQYLIYLNTDSKTMYDTLIKQFEAATKEYWRQTTKPTISEIQRKYVIKANTYVEQMMYPQAISYFYRAIEINPLSYSDAYYNLALLSARIKRFDAAIYNMKKYILLNPYSENARAGQDKIYEWETKLWK